MATNLLTFGPSVIRASASAGHKRPESSRRRSFSSAAPSSSSSSPNWWTPLFGWPSEPDYIDSGNNNKADRREDKAEPRPDPELDPRPARPSRFAPGCFTAEKAKQLRMMTQDAGSFHDVMYHSAIASRLASDFGSCPDL